MRALIVLLMLLALTPCLSARADGVNQFEEVSFTSPLNGPGDLDIYPAGFLVTGSRVGARVRMGFDEDPEYGYFDWGFYASVAPSENGVTLTLRASGGYTDPVNIEFTYGISAQQDAIINALRSDPNASPATTASRLNTLRGLYP